MTGTAWIRGGRIAAGHVVAAGHGRTARLSFQLTTTARAAGAERLAGGEHASRAVATVGSLRTHSVGIDARGGAAHELAAAVWNAGRAIAAIERVAACFTGLPARGEAIAAGYAERIELADTAIAGGAATVVASRRVPAGLIVLVVANIALGIAAHRIAAYSDCVGRVLLDTGNVAVSR